jgi:hypothetical protein
MLVNPAIVHAMRSKQVMFAVARGEKVIETLN